MSFITKSVGLDPLIAHARRGEWLAVLTDVQTLIRRYVSAEKADAFGLVITVAKFPDVFK